MPVDLELANNAVLMADRLKESMIRDTARQTGMDNPNSDQQMLTYLHRMYGVELPDMTKGTVERFIEDCNIPDVRSLLLRRAQWKKASTSKYKKMLKVVCADGRIRGAFQLRGAGRTGRWAGREVQLHNLPRGRLKLPQMELAVELVRAGDLAGLRREFINPMDVLSWIVRAAFRAQHGRLVVADLSSIESRMLGWVAQCKPLQQGFAQGLCAYKVFASTMFNIDYNEVDKEQRTLAKPAVLGCLGPDTEVLTLTGWRRIIELYDSELIFDGYELVRHGGVVEQGVKQVIELDGLFLTPDHKVLCGECDWREAEECLKDESLWYRALALTSGLLSVSGMENMASNTTFGATAGWSVGESPPQYCEATRKAAESAGTPIAVRLEGLWKWVKPWASTNNGLGQFRQSGTGIGRNSTAGSWLRSSGRWDQTRTRAKRDTTSRNSTRPRQNLWGTLSGALSEYVTHLKRRRVTLSPSFTHSHRSVDGSSRRMLEHGGLMPTYDILNCGPRNQFIVRTNQGPLIVHNCGYGLGGGEANEDGSASGLLGYGRGMGVHMTEDFARQSVKTWRQNHQEVVELWRDIDRAVLKCFRADGARTLVREGSDDVGLWFEYQKPFLRLRLPSGRHLSYLQPQYKEVIPPWERGKDDPKTIMNLTYMGLSQNGSWTRMFTRGAKFVEQICQGLSADVLAEGMLRADEVGIPIVGHVHDEIIAEGYDWEVSVQDLCDAMTVTPEWAPGLILGAEGFESEFYRKD